jgi:hypothetical protein
MCVPTSKRWSKHFYSQAFRNPGIQTMVTLWFGYFAPVTLKSRADLGMPRLKKIRSRVMIGVGMLSHSAMPSVKDVHARVT